MTTKSDIAEWFLDNQATIDVIISDLTKSKNKLMEMEPVVFHEDIQTEFTDMALRQIVDILTKDLAIPAEVVYNTIEDKELLIKTLGIRV